MLYKSILLYLISFVRFSIASKNTFYLGPNFPKPQFHNTEDEYIEVKIIKNSEWVAGEVGGEVYEGDTVEVTCYGSSKDRTQHHFLVLKNDSGEKNLNFTTSQVIDRSISSYRVVATYLDSGEYKCVFHSKSRIIEKTQQLNVIKVQMPKPRELHNENLSLQYGKEANIECEMVEGYPKSSYEWTKNRKTVGNSRALTIEVVDSDDAGEYLCTATNRAGKGYSVFNITVNGVPDGSQTVAELWIILDNPIVIALIPLILFTLLVLTVILIFVFLPRVCGHRRVTKTWTRTPKYTNNEGTEPEVMHEEVPLINLRKKLLIDSKYLTIVGELGNGNYGFVQSGKLRVPAESEVGEIMVAVKTALKKIGIYQKMIRQEYDVMMKIRPHPNVLTLIGGIRDSASSEIDQIVTEFCEFQSLLEYLRSYGGNEESSITLEKDLLSFSYQVTNGLEYLARARCIHRDLAARNVLLKSNKVCRIADFGLTRISQDKEYYRAKYKTSTPERWMAVETFSEPKYTQKSDVWSFAILLFEIFSLCVKYPFPDVDDIAVRYYIEKGHKNKKPERCSKEIYQLMKKCWSLNPKKRPNFSECLQFFEKELQSKDPSMYCELKKLLKEEEKYQKHMQGWFEETEDLEPTENQVASTSEPQNQIV